MSELMENEIVQDEQHFTVDDDQKAEWVLGRIREHKKEIEKWTAHYDAEKRRACMVHENAIIRLEADLKGYFFDRDDKGLTRETKTMTAYNLPTGKLMMKHQEPEYEKNEPEVLEWLRENAPEFIKTKESLDWAGMKEAYSFTREGDMVKVDEETGEIIKVPGIKAIAREDVFKVGDK